MVYEFRRWGEGKKYAVFYDRDLKREVVVPRSRLIPTLVCEATYSYLKDPNKIAERCAEESSVDGIVIFRHELHLLAEYNSTLVRELEKEYEFPKDIDFSCVREEVRRGKRDLDEIIIKCSKKGKIK